MNATYRAVYFLLEQSVAIVGKFIPNVRFFWTFLAILLGFSISISPCTPFAALPSSESSSEPLEPSSESSSSALLGRQPSFCCSFSSSGDVKCLRWPLCPRPRPVRVDRESGELWSVGLSGTGCRGSYLSPCFVCNVCVIVLNGDVR